MRGAALGLLLALALGSPAGGEAVGTEGIGRAALGGTPRVPPRAAALEAALRDAVRRAASELAGTPTSARAEAALDEALGPEPARFAVTYRTLSEREEARPTAPGRDLVLTVEAQIDRARLAAALRRAGLLPEEAVAAAEAGLQQIVVEPVPTWPALSALRRSLVALGAQRVLLASVEPGRVVLTVEGRSAESLIRAVIGSPPPGIRVEPYGPHDGAARIRLESVPIRPVESPAPIDTPASKR